MLGGKNESGADCGTPFAQNGGEAQCPEPAPSSQAAQENREKRSI